MTELEIKELAAAGLTPEDVEPAPVELWADNMPAYLLFCGISTQWRCAAGGATGLDYNVLYRKMDRMNLAPDDYDWLEHDIQVMESAALEAMRPKTDP
jgi:hypothetical protein